MKLRPGERRTLLFLGDLATSYIALGIALVLWAYADPYLSFSLEFLQTRTDRWFYLLPFIWITLMVELYDHKRSSDYALTFKGVAATALICLGLYMVFFFFYKTPENLTRRGVAYFLASASVVTVAWRFVFIRVFTQSQFLRRVLLVGAGETGKNFVNIYRSITPPPFILVGMIDDDPEKVGTEIDGIQTLAGSGELLQIAVAEGITDVIVAISGEMQGSMFQTLLDAQERGISITRYPVAYEELVGRIPIRYLEADWILRSFVDQANKSGFFELEKRILDLAVGLIGVFIFLLSFPLVALAIIIDSGMPIFYTQIRSGKGDQRYSIIKYRTMKQNAEPNGQPQWAEENDVRATRVGRILRKTHIDELPQFFNVVRGEMSLVGPRAERPELVEWFQQYVPFYRARLIVKPGITGWAQINYGYASTIDETITKLEYDLYYIKRRNILLDIIIVLRTPATVFGLRGR